MGNIREDLRPNDRPGVIDLGNMPESRVRALYMVELANPITQMVGVFDESARLIQTANASDLATYLETKANEINTILETAHPERAGMGITLRFPVGINDAPDVTPEVIREVFLGERPTAFLRTTESYWGREASLAAVCALLLSTADEIRERELKPGRS